MNRLKFNLSRIFAGFCVLASLVLLCGVSSWFFAKAAVAQASPDLAEFFSAPVNGKRTKVLRIDSNRQFFPVSAGTGKVGTVNNPWGEGNFNVLYSPTVRWGYQTVSSNTTLTTSSPTFTHCTNGSATITLASNPLVGFPQAVRSSGVSNVTVSSSDNIDGSSTATVPSNTTYVFQYTGSTWKRVLP